MNDDLVNFDLAEVTTQVVLEVFIILTGSCLGTGRDPGLQTAVVDVFDGA
jgi:hypothetical protein